MREDIQTMTMILIFMRKKKIKKIKHLQKDLEILKDNYEGYLKNAASEEYMKMLEKQRQLEGHVNELKEEKHKLSHLEENLQKMMKKLSQIKEKKS